MYHNETKCTHEIILLFGRQSVIFRTSLNNQLKKFIWCNSNVCYSVCYRYPYEKLINVYRIEIIFY